jgi:hypothetical protein
MDHLAFYKKNESLKEQISSFRISNHRPYTAYFLMDEPSLNRLLFQNQDNILLFYFAELLGDEDKQMLARLKSLYQNVSIALCSQTENALISWRMPVFHFEPYPITSEKVKYAYNKWVEMQADEAKEEIFKTDEGIKRIKHQDIAYIQAAGNYTMVHYKSDKCLVLTRQLGTFNELTENNPNFQRLHRSLILNMDAILNCHNNKVFFNGLNKPLEVSPMLESKVKSILL